MCKSERNIPIWLDIKTEYIDENFEKVLDYLANGIKTDAFYKTTVELLGKRVDLYLTTLLQKPVCYSESYNNYDIEEIKRDTRLIAAYLLVDKEDEAAKRKKFFMPFLHSLSLIVPVELSGDLLNLMIDNIIYENEPRLFFGWDDIMNFEPQILAHKIINGEVFPKPTIADISFEGNGILTVRDESLCIAAMTLDNVNLKKSQLVTSLPVIDDKIKLLTTKNEKLKQSDEEKIEALEKYVKDYILSQSKAVKPKKKPKKTYANGDALYMEITSCVFGKVKVKSTDPEYEEITGTLELNDNIYPAYHAEDFNLAFRVGQIIDATLKDYKNSVFSIKEGFVAHMIENVAQVDFENGSPILAKLVRINTDSRGVQQMDWFSTDGLPIHTDYNEAFQFGDFAYLKITYMSDVKKYYGYIQGTVLRPANEFFDVQMAKKNAIKGFDFPEDEQESAPSTLDFQTIFCLLNMMVRYQKTIANPTERYRVLCMSKVIATLVGLDKYQSYIGFVMDYLKQLVYFAKSEYEQISLLNPDEQIEELAVVKQRCDVVRILHAYNSKNSAGVLEDIIDENADESLTKIARLIQSSNIIGDVLPAATKNIIKREIAKCLSLETEDEMDLDDENGIYLGMEDQHQEFKTSFVYPPDNNMMPNVALQEKNIFKALCGFLNTDAGGTLYLGVTDLGYVCGIENDMKHLKMTELDTFTRFIQDRAALSFGEVDIISHFAIKPVYDNRVIAIRVEPYEDGVVELNGIAYIRINNETREMNAKLKRQIKEKKMAAKSTGQKA